MCAWRENLIICKRENNYNIDVTSIIVFQTFPYVIADHSFAATKYVCPFWINVLKIIFYRPKRQDLAGGFIRGKIKYLTIPFSYIDLDKWHQHVHMFTDCDVLLEVDWNKMFLNGSSDPKT